MNTPQTVINDTLHDLAIMELYPGDEATRPGFEYATILLYRRLCRANTLNLQKIRRDERHK